MPFAILHGAERLGSPDLTSDLDIVVGRPPTEIARGVNSDLQELHLEIAMIWPYDLGGTASIFVSSSDGALGAQVDCLYDPAGRGRYGVRSNVLLAERVQTGSFPTLAPLDRDLYLIRKARCKGRYEMVEKISSQLARRGAEERARELFSPKAARDVIYDLGGKSMHRFRILRTGGNLVRRLRRLAEPIGFWLELVGTEAQSAPIAEQLKGQFGGWLVRVDADKRPSHPIATAKWWLTRVLPVILRPALFISWTSEKSLWPVPNLSVLVNEEGNSELVGRRVVSEMAGRAIK